MSHVSLGWFSSVKGGGMTTPDSKATGQSLEQRVKDAREQGREAIRDRRKEPVAGPFWEAIDLLCALERAEAVVDAEHNVCVQEGLSCNALEALEAACTAIEGER